MKDTYPMPMSAKSSRVELGLDTFGDVPAGSDGRPVSYAAAIRATLDEAVVADRSGVDVFLVGEHHREEYAVSAPEVVLAGIAARTERIRIGSGVTVLSSDDPVRVFERFATVDAIANGRTEVILGRGSFTESFPLFGYDLADYQVLFEEKIELFAKLLDERPVTWSGSVRAPLDAVEVFPKTESGRLSTWVGVGGTPQSVIRAAHYGFPLMLAIIGGDPARFAPYVDLYRRAAAQYGTPSHPVGMHSPGFVGDTDSDAFDAFYPAYEAMHRIIGPERGLPPLRREHFEAEVAHGSLYLGSPDTVARKIAKTIATLGVGRFDLIYSMGAQPADARLRAVELYGTEVIPRVRELLAAAGSGSEKGEVDGEGR
jgi:probable LLM family oxidoreductase